MRTLGEDVISVARSWIGTPYRHQASRRGSGTDCLGLIRGVWRETVGSEPELLPAYTRDWSEVGREEALWKGAQRHLTPIDPGLLEVGDVILFRMRDGMVAKHLGFLSQADPHASFIHAYSGHGVIENALSLPWRRRIVAGFRFPERSV